MNGENFHLFGRRLQNVCGRGSASEKQRQQTFDQKAFAHRKKIAQLKDVSTTNSYRQNDELMCEFSGFKVRFMRHSKSSFNFNSRIEAYSVNGWRFGNRKTICWRMRNSERTDERLCECISYMIVDRRKSVSSIEGMFSACSKCFTQNIEESKPW